MTRIIPVNFAISSVSSVLMTAHQLPMVIVTMTRANVNAKRDTGAMIAQERIAPLHASMEHATLLAANVIAIQIGLELDVIYGFKLDLIWKQCSRFLPVLVLYTAY